MSAVFMIFPIIFWIFWLIIIVSIVKSVANRRGGSASGASKPDKAANKKIKSAGKSKAKHSGAPALGRNEEVQEDQEISEKIKGLRASPVLTEDRKNDWLARQLKEEERIFMKSEMYSLKEAHAASCEARELKEIHRKNHGKY